MKQYKIKQSFVFLHLAAVSMLVGACYGGEYYYDVGSYTADYTHFDGRAFPQESDIFSGDVRQKPLSQSEVLKIFPADEIENAEFYYVEIRLDGPLDGRGRRTVIDGVYYLLAPMPEDPGTSTSYPVDGWHMSGEVEVLNYRDQRCERPDRNEEVLCATMSGTFHLQLRHDDCRTIQYNNGTFELEDIWTRYFYVGID
jgi:hypothetical protein